MDEKKEEKYVLGMLITGMFVLGVESPENPEILKDPWHLEYFEDPRDQRAGSVNLHPKPLFFPIESENSILYKSNLIAESTPPQKIIDFYKEAKRQLKSKIIAPQKPLYSC